MSPEPPAADLDYLKRVEVLAHDVVTAAASEGWVAFGDESNSSDTPLMRAVNALATELRLRHYEGDGCVDH